MVWRATVPKKVRFFIWQVLLGRVNTVDRLVRKRTLLVSPFCCILCWKVEEDLDYFFSRLPLCEGSVELFLQEFNVSFAGSRSVRATIVESFPPSAL